MDLLNLEKLGAYLEQHIKGFTTLISAEKFSGGQSNPTYLLNAVNDRYVLRSKPPGKLLKSAHAVDREYRVIHALDNTDVPVAKALHLCEDEDVIGSIFYVMSFEDGRIFWDPALPEINKDQRNNYHNELIKNLAAIHNVDLDAVNLNDYGRPGNYFERQIKRWTEQYKLSETKNIQSMNILMDWLSRNLPIDDGQISLIHGDYRFDNIIFHAEESQALAVLDWELSTLGHPLSDLAYYCMCLRLPADGQDVKGLAGKNRNALGVPDEQTIIEQYCEHRGIPAVHHWRFYLAFSFFRLAAICQGVYKRGLDGNASNKKALEIGKLVGPLSKSAVDLIA